jgi:hypothetical protein
VGLCEPVRSRKPSSVAPFAARTVMSAWRTR